MGLILISETPSFDTSSDMGRSYAAAAAAASHFYRNLRQMKMQKSAGGVHPRLLDELASMKTRAIPNKRIKSGEMTVVLPYQSYELYKKYIATETSCADCLAEMEKDPKFSTQPTKTEAVIEKASNFMVLVSLINSGGLSVGVLEQLSHSSNMASFLLKKFSGEYELGTAIVQLSIVRKLALIKLMTKNIPRGGPVIE